MTEPAQLAWAAESPPQGDISDSNTAKAPKAEVAEAKEAKDDTEVPPTALERLSASVHSSLEAFFYRVGVFCTARPWSTIAVTIIITLVLAQGFWFYSEETDSAKQFTPQSNKAVDDREWVNDVFGNRNKFVEIYFTRDSEKGSILDRDALLYVQSYYDWMTTEAEGSWKGQPVNYTFCCYRQSTTCVPPSSPLLLWGNQEEALRGEPDILGKINDPDAWSTAAGSGAPISFYLGKVASREGYPIGYAEGIKMVLKLKFEKVKIAGRNDDDPHSYEFELALVHEPKWRRNDELGITISVLGEAVRDEEGSGAIQDDIGSLVFGYIMMVIFACTVLSRSRVKYSHNMLGVFSVLSVGMSTISAYGLAWFMGIKFNNVTQVLILVLLGVGIDDTFVIMDQWLEHHHISCMKERMRKALSHAGPAITVTSVTDLVAFLSGSSTVLPALRDFCFYASIGITIDFLYQCTFFVAVAYLDSVRQGNNRAAMPLCCLVVGDHDGHCGTKPCDATNRLTGVKAVDSQGKYIENERGLVHHVMGTRAPQLILGSHVAKGMVIAITLAFLVSGIYGLTELEMNFDNEWFTPSDSPLKDVYRTRDEYFGGRIAQVSVYTKGSDYANNQHELHRLTELAAENPWIVPGTLTFWYLDFHKWLASNYTEHNTSQGMVRTIDPAGEVNKEHFYHLLNLFLDGPGAVRFSSVVRMNAERNSIIGAYFTVSLRDGPLRNGQEAVDCMDSLRASFDGAASSLQSFVYGFFFIFWESYKVIAPETLRNVGVAAACVFVLVTVLVANIQMGVIIVVIILAVDTCLLGFMPFVGLYLNNVSVVCIVLAIGLAVDYSVHIAHAFLLAKGSRVHRAAYAMWMMGPAVANGGFSTFLAIFPLVASKSYVFFVFFRMFALIILFGLWFGLFALPVLLSYIGPAPLRDAKDLDTVPWECPLHPKFELQEPEVELEGSAVGVVAA